MGSEGGRTSEEGRGGERRVGERRGEERREEGRRWDGRREERRGTWPTSLRLLQSIPTAGPSALGVKAFA